MDEILSWFFKGWEAVGRAFVVGILAYIGLIVVIRTSGKRTLSQMNAFDLVVTVALGSTLATILLSRQTGLIDGIMGFITLIGLQFLVSWLSIRFPWFCRLIKNDPTLLFYQGRFLKEAMRQQRVDEDEVLSAIRSAKIRNLADVQAVVLENNGMLTVVRTSPASGPTSLDNLYSEPKNN